MALVLFFDVYSDIGWNGIRVIEKALAVDYHPDAEMTEFKSFQV